MLKVLCIAMVEDRANLDEQILKQTVQPDRVVFYIDETPAKGITERRKRIAENHSKLQAIVRAYKPDLVWQVEGDSVYPEDCLERLVARYQELNNKGMIISGLEIGRHGLYCLGAWKVASDKKSFESLDYKLTGIQKVDAVGFYCMLADTDTWLSGKATWDGEPYGPDVTFCLSIKKPIYVDMGLHIGHQIKNGIIEVSHPSTCNAKFWIEDGRWKFKQLD